jgi:hypothetical protein
MSRLKDVITSSFSVVLQKFWDENRDQFSSALVESFEKPSLKQHLFNPVTNKRWLFLMEERCKRAASTTYDFIDKELMDVPYLFDKVYKWDDIKDTYISGHVLEFGVYQGCTVTHLSRIFPKRTIHGFDTFEGLPEDWNFCKKGAFNLQGRLPRVPHNVVLHKGLFKDTLPEWIENNQGNISFLNVDCDLYSSTCTVLSLLKERIVSGTVLSLLKERIVSGTVIHFDEMIGYYGWQHQEYKAFNEFIKETGKSFEYISYGPTYVFLRIL